MIHSAEEFVRLRLSSNQAEYNRAVHEEAPEEVWLRIIDRYPELRQWVAHNKTVPISVLAVLADDADASVRCTVAEKRTLTFALRQKLAQDPDASVRARLAHNRKCEKAILELLATDQEAFVREAAEKQLRKLRNASNTSVEGPDGLA